MSASTVSRISTLAVAVACFATAAVAAGAAPSTQTASSDALREKASRFIADLDSESYQQRETATRRLAQLGEPALRAIEQMVAQASPEAAWRATRVLGAMCSSDDESLADQAAAVLERFAEGQDNALANHARRELHDWRVGRQERAISALRELGGAVLIDPTASDQDSSYLVRIDENWQGGNKGLRALRNIVWLGTVEIRNSQISDEAIDSLIQARDMKRLHLWDHRLTRSGVERLKKARPADLEVSWFGEAVLGITGNLEHRQGCLITGVVGGTGADQAGLEAGDIITKIDGSPVEGFADLTLHMAERKVGERVPVEVRRDGALRKVVVVLGARRESARLIRPFPLPAP